MNPYGWKSFYMKEEEFYLLLAGKGVRRWYGLSSDRRESFLRDTSKEAVYGVLAGLYQKGYVDWCEEQVAIAEPMDVILQALKDSAYCVMAEQEGERQSYYLSYGKIVLVEESKRQRGRLKLTLLTKEEFLNNLWEEGYLPKREGVTAFDGQEGSRVKKVYDRAILRFLQVEDGRQMERLIIKEMGMEVLVTWEHDFSEEILPYQKDWCEKRLNQWCNRRQK